MAYLMPSPAFVTHACSTTLALLVFALGCGSRTAPLTDEPASVLPDAGTLEADEPDATGPSTFCNGTWAGTQICFGSIGASLAVLKSDDAMCQQQGGAVVATCPTEGQLGCCAFVRQGVTSVNCWYCGEQSSWAAVCETQFGGSWTPGSRESTNCGP
jgi:hypothetical protein